MNKIEFRKVRDFGAILNVTFDYIKININTLFKSNLFIAGPGILIAGIFTGLYQSSAFNFDYMSGFEAFGIPLVFAMFFSGIAYLLILTTTYSHMMIYKKSEMGTFGIEEIWIETKNKIFMVLFTAIGYLVIIVLTGLLTFGLGFYLTVEGYYIFILLILFGIWLVIYISINYSLIFIVRFEEGISFSEALSRSKELIKNNWWFTFGLVFVVGLIQGFLGFVFYIPYYILSFFFVFTGMEGGSGGFYKILFIITSIISLLVILLYAISIVATTFQYYNLVERKEAPGLLDQIEKII